jgi:CheY-like chemotaxis protein
MSLILVVDDMAIIREPIAAALHAAGYETMCAASGEEALAKVRAHSPQLMLLDLNMPGMNGLTALKVIRSDAAQAKLRVILLSASSDKKLIVEAARLGVRDYILKSNFSEKDLLARVGKYLPLQAAPVAQPAPATVTEPEPEGEPEEDSRHVSAAEVARRLSRAEIRAMPVATSQLISMASSPRATVGDAAEILKRDPVLTARVLKLANSAAFTRQRVRIATIEDAVKNVGLSAVRNMAASAAIFDMAGSEMDERLLRSWEHALAVAELMDQLAPHSDEEEHGLAYVVGLCQSLPEIMLRQYFPREFDQTMLQAQRGGQNWRTVAAEIFQGPYNEMMCQFLDRLGLPTIIATPIEQFLRRGPNDPLARLKDPIAQLLVIANYCVAGQMLSPSLDEPIRPILESEFSAATTVDPAAIDMPAIRNNAVMTTGLLAGISPSQLVQTSVAPINQQPIRLLYVRGRSYSTLDPVYDLLRLLAADVALQTENEEWCADLNQYSAIVLSTQNPIAQGELQDLAARLKKGNDGSDPAALCLTARPGKCTPVGGLQAAHLPTTASNLDKFLRSAGHLPAQAAA